MELGKRIVAICMSILLATQVDPLAAQAYAEALSDAVVQNGTNQTSEKDSADADSDSASQEGAPESEVEEEKPVSTVANMDASQASGAAADVKDENNDGVNVEDAGNEPSKQASEGRAADGYTFTTLSDLKSALDKVSGISDDGASLTELNVSGANDLIILSNASPELYQRAVITSSNTGSFDLTVTANGGYTFLGLGSKGCPFEGTLSSSPTYVLNRALFAGIKANTGDETLKLRFRGTDQNADGNLFADYVKGADSGDAAQLNIDASFANDNDRGGDAQIKAPLIGEVEGKVNVAASFKFANATGAADFSKNTAIETDGNAGLIARTVAKGGKLVLQSISGFKPASGTTTAMTNITSKSFNAGLLVGELGSDASFETCGLGVAGGTGFSKSAPTGTVKASKGAAGGLVGKTGENAFVKIVANEVDLSNLTVAGKYSGGFVGFATKIALDGGSFSGKLTLPKTIGDSDTQYAGGFIGKGGFANDYTFPASDMVAFSDTIVLAAVQASGNYDGAGGIFGQLDLTSNVTLSGREDVKSVLSDVSKTANYGGIAGRILRNANEQEPKSLTVQNVTAEANAVNAGKTLYYGGLVGWMGEGGNQSGTKVRTVLIVRNATVDADFSTAGRSFGGVAGCADGSATIDCGSFKLNTKDSSISSNGTNCFAGGIVGEIWEGALLRFSGTTDLTSARFSDSDRVAQLAGYNANALIFAVGSGADGSKDGGLDAGWTLDRGGEVGIDDLGSSGEVIRLTKENGLQSAFKMGSDFKVAIPENEQLKDSGGTITIESVVDFAKLAITLQTQGRYSGVYGFGNTNWTNLNSKNLSFTGDVDLTGTGLGGLTKDQNTIAWIGDSSTYTGSINGGGCSVTLAIGEPYGKRNGTEISSSDSSEGNGKIYRHNRLGLFAAMTNSVNNLKIKGAMTFQAKTLVNAGALAGRLANGAEAMLTAVESAVRTTCSSDGNYNAYVGGIFGVADGGATSLSFASGNKSSLKMSVTARGHRVVAGGAVGLVDGDGELAVTVGPGGLEIDGSYTAGALHKRDNSDAAREGLPVGGFIGMILGSAKKKTVTLSGLTISNFTLSSPKVESVGGMLGYLWTNTDVIFNNGGIKVINSTLGALGTEKIQRAGGLVYRASGKWQVEDGGIDLSGYTINSIQDRLGILVGQAGANKEHALEAEYRTEGLYLEVTARWDSACVLNKGICNCKPANYDEWVGSVTDTTNDNGPLNNVLRSGYNGVVSLRTNSGLVTMDDGANCNTYINRTNYGKTKNTNPSTRYYYNLDKIKSDIEHDADHRDETINTAQELMIWSLIKYADPTLASYFYTVDDTNCAFGSAAMGKITGTLDMRCYSYYPVDVDTSLTIENADITFYNKQIESSEDAHSNKVTSDATQHMSMHSGLIRNFTASSVYANNSRTLLVKNVSLAGSVGLMSTCTGFGDYGVKRCSGALICGDAYGFQTASGERNTCTINIDGLTLDGIGVYKYGEYNRNYAPLVVNAMGSYVDLAVANVSLGSEQAKGTKVATSLMGNLGGANETQISATFSDIALPSKTGDGGDAIFSMASLLNSFAYRTDALGMGSATYNFYKNDANAVDKVGNYKATFGAEIDRNGTEYSGAQLWYFDESTFGDDDGLVVAPGTSLKANIENPIFGDYLPYVFTNKNNGQASNHEIRVNQRLEDLTTGCGTYADPYVIAKESKLVALTSYVNDNKPTDGWRITIAEDQSRECRRRAVSGTGHPDMSNEVTYTYRDSDGQWHENGGNRTLSNETMRRYVSSCYIDIQTLNENGEAVKGTLTVHTSKFAGLGSVDNAFRGVLTSTNGTTLEINHDERGGSFSGLIKYSYGCVVKGIPIKYTGCKNTVSYAAKDTKHAAPGSFFGGVFGNVLGGDNIIDGVTLTADSFSIGTSGSKDGVDAASLVPVGGYVGVVTGGGVLFRGSMGASWYSGNSRNYYDNPVVGRVLDGYAFVEGDDCNVGDNTVPGKVCNYKVNPLDVSDVAAISTGDLHNSRVGNDNTATITSVSDKQGLLVLSAIINSGAAVGPMTRTNSSWVDLAGSFNGTNAYMGKAIIDAESGYSFGNGDYGKVRNALYDSIGKPGSSDFSASVIDDTRAPGITSSNYPHQFTDSEWSSVNAPYLVSKYCANKKTLYICGAGYNSMDLSLSANEYDMRDYGNAYRGLSGVYYTNALMDSANDRAMTYSRDRAIPWVAHIGGVDEGSVLKVDEKVAEYNNDDFNTVGVGALFSYAMFTRFNVSETVGSHDDNYIENLKISDSTIAHSCGKMDADWAVGGIAGIATAENGMTDRDLKLSNVRIEHSTVSGPSSAGGFFGNSGVWWRVSDGSGTFDSTSIAQPISTSGAISNKAQIAFAFVDCSFADLTLSAGYHVGGYVGLINGSVAGRSNSVTVTQNATLGMGSKITTTSSNIASGAGKTASIGAMGGIFGRVNAPINFVEKNGATATLRGVEVKNNANIDGAGGLVGRAGSLVNIDHVLVTGDGDSKTEIGSTRTSSGNRFSSGLVGNAYGNVSISDTAVSNIKLISPEGDGVAVAQVTSGISVNADNFKAENVEIAGSCSGGFTGVVSSGGSTISVMNSSFKNIALGSKSVINRNWAKGNQSGVITGDARGTFRLSNILIDSCTFGDKKYQGILAGNAVTNNNFKGFYVAGLEVRGVADAYPPRYFAVGDTDDSKMDANTQAINKKSFVSFANYDGTAVKSDERLYDNATQAEPWVTTSPVSDTKVADGYLYGDGAGLEAASRIVGETSNSGTNAYIYANRGGQDSDGKWSTGNAFNGSFISTYGNNNEVAPAGIKDYKVLQVSGGDTGVIEGYLNAVTNGAFSDAANFGNGYEKVETLVYKLNDSGELKQDVAETPNVSYNPSTKSFNISSKYDNGENKFTLVKVTFSADGKAGQADDAMSYVVMVPVVVRRQLETTVTATLDHGTNFSESNYATRGDRVRLLESFGNSSTALITFRYNKAFSTPTEYGWDSYLAAGGSMGPVNKTIVFNSNGVDLPEGTKFTLIDKDNGDHTYSYTLSQDSSSIDLASFQDTEGSGTYAPKWMSELMGVSAAEADAGAWVPCAESDATAKAKDKDGMWKNYRPYRSTDGSVKRYDLTCEKGDNGKEITPFENFYLVIYIPQDGNLSDAQKKGINGNIAANIECDGVKFGTIKYALRPGDGANEDKQSNTASTYNFVSAYEQTLKDYAKVDGYETNLGNDGISKEPDAASGAGRVLHMDVIDDVKVDKEQVYLPTDPLYYKLDASFETHQGGNVFGSPFPTGVNGDLEFYVFTRSGDEKTYWSYDIESKSWKPSEAKTPAYTESSWTSDGNQKSFACQQDLALMRQKAKNDLDGHFYIETKMDIHLSEEACKAAIVATKPLESGAISEFTRLKFRASLADSIEGLASSSTVKAADGDIHYYREDVGASTISLTANDTSQLGINLNDLGSMGDGNIGATGIYDMTGLSNADNVLDGAGAIKYNITLWKRLGTDGNYAQVTEKVGDYVGIACDELGTAKLEGSVFTWTDEKESGGFQTKDKTANKFKLSLSVKVDTALNAHEYANYQIRLQAVALSSGSATAVTVDTPVNKVDTSKSYDYITYTLTRVKLDGLE